MSDNKVTLDQLDDSAVEAMSSSVGDVSMLNTENTTIVGALVEIVGKKEIANAIGEPLAETDKFTEMSSEINGLLSTFKTNMMNAGVVVESGDKFKALIEKIQGLTEGEGNKGIQYAEGVLDDIELGYGKGETTEENFSRVIVQELDFVPTFVAMRMDVSSAGTGYSDTIAIDSDKDGGWSWKPNPSGSTLFIFSFNEFIDKKFELNVGTGLDYDSTATNVKWYAIGVGEEDTTLRDSLADILENKGVEVTEEDDMASLITKVNSLKVQSDIPFAGSGETLYTQESTSSHKNNTYSLAFSYIHTGKSGSIRVYFMLYSSGYNVYAEIVKKSGDVTTQLKEFNTVSSSICSLDVDINTGDEIIVNGRCISTAGTCDIYDGTITCNYRIL